MDNPLPIEVGDSGSIGSLHSLLQAALDAHHEALALSDEHTCEICGLFAFVSASPR